MAVQMFTDAYNTTYFPSRNQRTGDENLGGSVVFSKSVRQEENYLSPQNTAGGVMAEALANSRLELLCAFESF